MAEKQITSVTDFGYPVLAVVDFVDFMFPFLFPCMKCSLQEDKSWSDELITPETTLTIW